MRRASSQARLLTSAHTFLHRLLPPPLHLDCREFRGGNRYFFAPKRSDDASMHGTASGFQYIGAVSRGLK